MTPLQLRNQFDRFVSANPVAVIGFVADGDGDAAFVAVARAVAATQPVAAFATVAVDERGLYEMFGRNGTERAARQTQLVP